MYIGKFLLLINWLIKWLDRMGERDGGGEVNYRRWEGLGLGIREGGEDVNGRR